VGDKAEWFAPRRYGIGAGVPISWQGWAVSFAYAGAMVGAALLLRRHPLQLVAVLIPLTVVFVVVTARTTRGGWRWRWGKCD
jgi:hypothetical protein